MSTYLEAVQIHPRGYPERLASDIANDPEALAYLGGVGGGGAVTESETTPGAAALADDATPDGALDDRIAALEDAPGGASPIIESDWVTITDAQFKGMPGGPTGIGIPYEIVPAPGAGKFLRFVAGAAILDTTAGPYGDAGANAVIQFQIAGEAVSQPLAQADIINWFEAEEEDLLYFPPFAGFIRARVSNIEDLPIQLSASNDVHGVFPDATYDFTGGNAANTLKVKVWYTEVAFS
jgi:hypothetical protein